MVYSKKLLRLMAKVIALILFTTGCINYIPMFVMTADAKSKTTDWIGVSSKYLELGTIGKDSFDFNINSKELKPEDDTYWYIRSRKGTPNCITIDHKTGVVKALSAGTAYIRCRITRQDKVIARPEAEVTVYNKITEVAINNLPANLTISAGRAMDFNRTILHTAAGKSASSNAITRWEVAEDSAGVGTVTEFGQLLPIQAGSFRIRAVSFINQSSYELWMSN